jgi:pSer/pThr/pTyr-binding forkhead associated (FHA) protein
MDMDKTAIGVMEADEPTQALNVGPGQPNVGPGHVVPDPQVNATQMAMNVDCPVCKTPNPPSETYCIDCGFLLTSAPVSVAETPETPSVGKLITTDGTREFPLNMGANTVGRENADVLLAHNTVSRNHATVTVENGAAWVVDAGSTNGTAVAGQRIAPGEKAELTDGCDVMFGSFVLKYQAPAQSEEPTEGGEQRAESEEPIAEGAEPRADSEEPVELLAQSEIAEEPKEAPTEEAVAPVGKLVSKDGTLSFDLHDGTNSIGRREGDNEIVIPDPYCSGRHAELSFADGKFTLTDIGSTNGTFVNGVKLEIDAPREVQGNDEITLGRTVFVLMAGKGNT